MVFAWNRRASPGGKAFATMMTSVVWWTLFAALEAAAVDPALKVSLSKVEYVGTVSHGAAVPPVRAAAAGR